MGGGGGGGKANRLGEDDNRTGGGGSGGQSYIYNYLQTNDINYNIQVGSKGDGGNNNTLDSSGGDSIVTWEDDSIQYNITGYGGVEGEQYDDITSGGSYNIFPTNLSNIGGDVGGVSIKLNLDGDHQDLEVRNPGGKISTQLWNITLNSGVRFWNILDEFFMFYQSYHVSSYLTQGQFYGAGGPGGQNATSRSGNWDPAARPGYAGGPGYVFIIFDLNNTSPPTT